MVNAMGFRQKVIARLEELGMSRQELALRAGVSKSYVYKLLMEGPGNRENPSPEIKQKIAAALGLAPSDLEDTHDLNTYLITALYELPSAKRKELSNRHKTPHRKPRIADPPHRHSTSCPHLPAGSTRGHKEGHLLCGGGFRFGDMCNR